MTASLTQGRLKKAIFLSSVMVLMTQLGHTGHIDFTVELKPGSDSKMSDNNTSDFRHVVLINNSEMTTQLFPTNYAENATWGISPDLPNGIMLNLTTGIINGTPSEVLNNTTYTLWANLTDGMSIKSNFRLEVLEDSDGDGVPDFQEINCDSDSFDANDSPGDIDGDGICDSQDDDRDGDGLNNLVETNTGIYISPEDSGTNELNPDTDGDGYCDGNASPNQSVCSAGPDAFPTDISANLDTDGDGDPDIINPNYTTILVEDLDDDNDGASDIAESECGTDPLNANDVPSTDSDGNCIQLDANPESLVEWNWGWCFCLIILLLSLLAIPIVLQKDKTLLKLSGESLDSGKSQKNKE